MTTLVRRGPVVIPGPPQPAVRCVACGSTEKVARQAYKYNDLELCEDGVACAARYRMGMTPSAYQLYLKGRDAVRLAATR